MTTLEHLEAEARELSPDEQLELIKRLLNSLPRNTFAPNPKAPSLRPYALAKGTFIVPLSFDDPLPDDLLDAFEGR
ncbi:DUF2281 domain-containing protein [Armatimonas sp.]|uniref:DUF2281 domain-containing protein n=1 Tax=Armatimonas sp. TaxID=1872638 RepID=UPI00375364E9